MKINSNKKSQTTIFMIVGLMIIIGGVIFFYSTQNLPGQLEPEIKIVQEQVPAEFSPIRDYAAACAYSTAAEGLKIIGKQGGYISFSDSALNKEAFSITQNPTESDAVIFTKDSELKIPYWWHLKSANNCREDCKFASKRPELRSAENSIEKQLERYIDLNFKGCLNNFEPFAEQGFSITEAGKLKSDVTIGSSDVIVLVDYPLNVGMQDANAKITQYPARLPVNLDKVYDLATKISNLEIKHRYIEKHALNLLAAFSGVDSERLPPMSDMQFKFGSSTNWRKSEVKNKITGLLASYIPLFQVDGTYNYERNNFNSELKQRLYDSTIIPVANSTFKDLQAQFTYLDFWPVHFDLNCKGENCAPSSANSFFSFFGIQEYRFAYDLSFPVLVEIQDPFAFNSQGYSFNLFLEGNIRNNKPMPADFAPLERASLSESSLLCDVKTSGNVTVAVVNSANKNAVDDANVLYTVIDESCFIGSTNKEGTLKEKFPVAVGGVVNVVKDGYIGKIMEFDPELKKESSLKVDVTPLYRKKLIVRKKNVVKTQNGWQFISTAAELGQRESASVALTRVNAGNEIGFSSAAVYEGGQTEIEIAPGNYFADISLMLNERIVIPERQKCFRKGIFNEKECFTIPKIDFGEKSAQGQEIFPSGGLKLNFAVNAQDLEKYDTIVLYAVSIDFSNVPEQDRAIEDIEQISKIEEYSSTYQVALQPTFQ
ncbi:hypothetical protein HYV80_06565 [Candidatus Woesearchaeota archaeon]|nr:hypothetical protein [Candidatus Woesearchaeota archaeon]